MAPLISPGNKCRQHQKSMLTSQNLEGVRAQGRCSSKGREMKYQSGPPSFFSRPTSPRVATLGGTYYKCQNQHRNKNKSPKVVQPQQWDPWKHKSCPVHMPMSFRITSNVWSTQTSRSASSPWWTAIFTPATLLRWVLFWCIVVVFLVFL